MDKLIISRPAGNVQMINVDGLGMRNPVTDHEQIIWFCEMLAKKKGKALKTRRLLDLLSDYEELLWRVQAYELLDYLNKHITKAQRLRRDQGRLLRSAQLELNLAGLREWCERREKVREFLRKMRGDINLN